MQEESVARILGELRESFESHGGMMKEAMALSMKGMFAAPPLPMLEELKVKNFDTLEHSLRVSCFALGIGREMGLNETTMTQLGWGGLLHDVGKLSVAQQILTKAERLDAEEFGEMKRHTIMGYELLNSGEYPNEIREIALFHHERFDGNGYLYQLKGAEIPLLARICAVADAYDAMTSARCYKEERTEQDALAELKRCAGGQFDPEVVSAFFKSLQ